MLPLASLSPVDGNAVVAKFDGGLLSSNGGVLALREVVQATPQLSILGSQRLVLRAKGGVLSPQVLVLAAKLGDFAPQRLDQFANLGGKNHPHLDSRFHPARL